MKSFGKNLFVWLGLLFAITLIYDITQSPQKGESNVIDFSDFLQEVNVGGVSSVTIQGNLIKGERSDGSQFITHSPEYPDLITDLRNKDVRISVSPSEEGLSTFWSIVISWFPIFLLIGVYVFFMRQMQGGGRNGGGALGFGKSRARMLNEDRQKATFKDVAGVDEAKEDLYEIVDFLKNPQKYQSLGGKIPKGCLLVGPPGTGKTLLARAVAGEAEVPFFTISGSDFVEMFVGVGASRVRDMFEQGKRNAPCLIFIDEIDAVGRHRGAGLGGGNDEREQTLNQLLVEMDGFESHDGVILIAATNRPDVLDPALLRPGRFDRQIVVPVPDITGREQILKVHMAKVPTGPDVDVRILARGTPGFSGADLANLINEAALLAARNDRKVVTMKELEDAKDKVMMGAERKSLVMKEEEKKLTAYHEAGHAIVAIHSPASDPIHKATIIPRGRALGLVMRLPEDDRVSMTREKLHADLAVAMGGRIAEEQIFGYDKVTSGASSDIKQATNIARAMVTEWGMSDKVGPLYHSSEQQEVFLGHSLADQKTMSENTANLIDAEVKRIVEEAYDHAKKLLKKQEKQLHALAEALLEYETLSGSDIKDVLAGKFDPNKNSDKTKSKTTQKSVLPSRKKKTSSSAKNTKDDDKK